MSADKGGTITAIGRDGLIRAGWPVTLPNAGAVFLSIAIGPDGTAYALVAEPTANGRSAAILALGPNGSIRYRVVVVQP